MLKGFEDYNCFVRWEKSPVNFDAVTPSGERVSRLGETSWFPWCNHLINTETLEIRCDYSRYKGTYLPSGAPLKKYYCLINKRNTPSMKVVNLQSIFLHLAKTNWDAYGDVVSPGLQHVYISRKQVIVVKVLFFS